MSELAQGVPLLDLKRSLGELEPALQAAFTRVLRSGHYILGPEVLAFEQAVAAYCGARHGIGVSSGSDALLLALMALDVGPGDEVICPSLTFFASAGAIWRLGARPVFMDSCPGCYNMLADGLAARINPKTKAIMPVHLFGQTAAMEQVLGLARARGVAVVEDAAQAIGAEFSGQRAGSLGDIGCFSFFPSKNLGAFGDAGLVTTNDDALAAKMRILRVHGGAPKYYHKLVGGNFRIDALQAALLSVKLPGLDRDTAQRQQNAALYTRLFLASGVAAVGVCLCTGNPAPVANEPLITLPVQSQSRHTYNQYVIRLSGERRDAVRQRLTAGGIGHEVYYPVPLHLQECFAKLGHHRSDLPHAERAAAQTVALPIFPHLTPDEINRVVQAVVAACTA